ncbi:hypothetical protein J6590_037870 [Homalodisca vitripennis]|nr:hypothetical protein J6590_037870 [Homalodisca vitripennis]
MSRQWQERAVPRLRSIADVGQGSLQPHSAADGGRRDERCATSVMSVWTDATPRQCDMALTVMVCKEMLDSAPRYEYVRVIDCSLLGQLATLSDQASVLNFP